MNGTKFTVVFLASMVLTSAYGVNANDVKASLEKYLVAANERAATPGTSYVYDINNLKVESNKFVASLPKAAIKNKGYAKVKIDQIKTLLSKFKYGEEQYFRDTDIVNAQNSYKAAIDALNDDSEASARSYLNNMDAFWQSRVSFWKKSDFDTLYIDTQKAIMYNDGVNFYTLQVLSTTSSSSIKGSANIDKVAYTLSTIDGLGNKMPAFSDTVFNLKVNPYLSCTANINKLKDNAKINVFNNIVSHKNLKNTINKFLQNNAKLPVFLANSAAEGIYALIKDQDSSTDVYQEAKQGMDLLASLDPCDLAFVTEKANSGNIFAKALVITVNSITKQITANEDVHIDDTFKGRVYSQLIAMLSQKIDKQLSSV